MELWLAGMEVGLEEERVWILPELQKLGNYDEVSLSLSSRVVVYLGVLSVNLGLRVVLAFFNGTGNRTVYSTV